MRARCIDDVPLQNIAIVIRRIVHRGFTIARIGIDEATLVPIGAHRHRQHVLNGEAVAAIGVGEIGMFGERGKKRRFRRRHFRLLQRDAVEQTHDAFRAGTQIVHRVGREGDVADPADGACVILAFQIAFQHQAVVVQHDEPMQIPDAFICDSFSSRSSRRAASSMAWPWISGPRSSWQWVRNADRRSAEQHQEHCQKNHPSGRV